MSKKESSTKKRYLQRNDCILLISILVLGCVGMLVLRLKTAEAGNLVRVMQNGELYGEYFLDSEQEFTVYGEAGYNTIVISNGKVFLKEADCPDQYCVLHTAIGKKNQAIVCLPHKLVVQIQNDISDNAVSEIRDEMEIDGYVE